MNILIIASIPEATGNRTTALRISKQMEELGHSCSLKCINEFRNVDEFCAWIRFNDIQCVLALHAYRTSHLVKGCDVPYSIVFGGTDVNEHSHNTDKLRAMTSVVKKAKYLVAFTDSLKSQAKRLWPCVSCRLIKQPQAVYTNPSMFSFRQHLKDSLGPSGVINHHIVILLVASLRPVKDPLSYSSYVWFDAEWHRMDERIYLVIIGPRLDVDYAIEVETLIARLHGVCLLPPFPQPDVHAAIQSADMVINTSKSEGTPQAVLEAMQLRTPVLVRNIPGNADVVTDYKTGLLFESPEEFVWKAKELLSSPTLQQSLTQEAYEYMSRVHSWNEEKQTYHKAVLNMVHGKSGQNTDV